MVVRDVFPDGPPVTATQFCKNIASCFTNVFYLYPLIVRTAVN